MAKNVLITGASRGIGAATAREFARAGWNVAIHYCAHLAQAQAVEDGVRELGAKTMLLQGDVSEAAQAQSVVAGALTLGALDALVCNAGIALPQQLLTDTTDAQWRQVMAVDLDGIFHTIRAAYPHFVRQRSGAIVTVSSMWGVTGGSCEVAYSAAKAGVIGMTKATAKELGPSNIRVNCVAAGVIATDMNAHLSGETLAQLGEDAALGRIGTAQDVAQAIYFLASERSSFITGQVLHVDGGMVI